MGSIDHEVGRVWWFGPFVDTDDPTEWRTTADRLDEAARARLPGHVREEEYAFDTRHLAGHEWATSRGFVADPGSAVITLEPSVLTSMSTSTSTSGSRAGSALSCAPASPTSSSIRSLVTDSARSSHIDDTDIVDSVSRLHDELFPGTHTTGTKLVERTDPHHPRLVALLDGEVVGYVAAERQPDGNGYLDFVGVAPSARRRGVGAGLVRAAVATLVDLGCERIHLTVRDDNLGARALYSGLGFVEERVIRPYRRGFTLT